MAVAEVKLQMSWVKNCGTPELFASTKSPPRTISLSLFHNILAPSFKKLKSSKNNVKECTRPESVSKRKALEGYSSSLSCGEHS